MTENSIEINHIKAINIMEKVKKLIDNYDPLVSSEQQDKEITRNIKTAQSLLDDAKIDIEVEDFLLNGPKGKDPK
jgi:hypothetical protein